MTFSVRQKLIAFAALSIATTLLVGGSGYRAQQRQSAALGEMTVKLAALRNHLESDMMHDALRADVLAALHAGSKGQLDEAPTIKTDLADHVATFRGNIEASAKLQLPADIKAALGKVTPVLNGYEASAQRIIEQAFVNPAAAEALLPEFSTAFTQLEEEMEQLSDLIETSAAKAQQDAEAVAEAALREMAILLGVAGILCSLMSWFLIRTVTRPLGQLRQAISALRRDTGVLQRLRGFTAEFAAIETEFNGVLDGIETQRNAERERADAAFRVQQALDAAAANIVLTNDRLEVTYLNATATRLFTAVAGDLKRDLPGFDPAGLIGHSIGALYRDPAAVQTLGALTGSSSADFTLGGRAFQVTSTPVRDAQGQRIGTVCEWVDLTQQREAERQIAEILQAAEDGELQRRLDTTRLAGFTQVLGEGVNRLLDAIVNPLRIAATQLSSIAEGNIPQPIAAEFKGEFNSIKNNVNTCTAVLQTLLEDARALASAAAGGRLETRADLSRHWGDFRSIVAGMNDTLDAMASPLGEASRVLDALAHGDLTKRMEGSYLGDFAALRDHLNKSIDNLRGMVSEIGGVTASINTSAGEIAKGNQDLSQRTMQQADALQETSASLRELTETVNRNSADAREANSLAAAASSEASSGRSVVEQAVTAMSEINQSSRRIADIIGVIDEIAFQTNLLALNAAVEAARAGDQGRGFAVVASEVRGLAQRSATAAKEIKTLINDSVNKVDEGSRLVNESGSTLGGIVGAVQKVSAIMNSIAAASEQQRTGIEGLNRAVTEMDHATQQNAALVEEAAAASESMDDQTRSLARLMGNFKTAAGAAAPGAASGPVRPAITAVATSGAPLLKRAAGGGDAWADF